MRRDQRHGDAELFRRADQMVGVIGLEGQPEQRRDRAERDIALVPVETQASTSRPSKSPLQITPLSIIDAVGAGLRTGQSEAGNLAASARRGNHCCC